MKRCAAGATLLQCEELESSLGLFSGIQGLLCGCLMHIEERQDAPSFPQSYADGRNKALAKGKNTESVSVTLLTEMRTKSFGEETLFSGDYSVLYASVGPAKKMVFLVL